MRQDVQLRSHETPTKHDTPITLVRHFQHVLEPTRSKSASWNSLACMFGLGFMRTQLHVLAHLPPKGDMKRLNQSGCHAKGDFGAAPVKLDFDDVELTQLQRSPASEYDVPVVDLAEKVANVRINSELAGARSSTEAFPETVPDHRPSQALSHKRRKRQVPDNIKNSTPKRKKTRKPKHMCKQRANTEPAEPIEVEASPAQPEGLQSAQSGPEIQDAQLPFDAEASPAKPEDAQSAQSQPEVKDAQLAAAQGGQKKKKKKKAMKSSQRTSEHGTEDEIPLADLVPMGVGGQAGGLELPANHVDEADQVVFDVALPGKGAPICCKCRNPITEARSGRIIGKCFSSWICRTCNARQVQVHRCDQNKAFIKGFKGLDLETQTQFWKSIHGDGSMENVKQSMSDFMENWFERSDFSKNAGDYQPLSWYERQGYDVEQIKEHCKDTVIHDILGLCYRVRITGGGTMSNDVTRRSQMMNPNRQEPTTSAMPASSSARLQPSFESEQAQTQAAKDLGKALAIDRKKIMAEATKVVGKLSAEQVQMDLFMKTKGIKDLPPVVLEKLQTSIKSIKEMVSNAKAVLGGKATTPPSFLDAADMAKRAVLQRQFVNQLLANNMASQMP